VPSRQASSTTPARSTRPRLIPALDGLGARNFGPTLQAALRYDARTSAPHVRLPDVDPVGAHDRLLPLWMAAGYTSSSRVPNSFLGRRRPLPMIEHPERFDALVAYFINGR